MTRPDFSPAMLMLFLRARALHAMAPHRGATRREGVLASFRNKTRRSAGLTFAEFDMAWMGRLNGAVPRARLWAVLGHFPADHGLVLTDDGGASHG